MPHQGVADTVHRLDVLLLGSLDGHEPHVRSADRLTHGFGIVGVVLQTFDERFHELWRDQLDLVASGTKLARPVMRATTSFHTHLTARLDGRR